VPPPTDLHIPATVQGVLAARIDRLSAEEKALLQQLAVIGREFPLSLARQVVSHSEDELYRVLASLQAKEFLYEQPAFPEVEYSFKHALTQEVAYGTVLQEQRKALHECTAQALEVLYRTSLDEHYSALAHHYSRSGNTRKAIHYLHAASTQAAQRSANVEAITHLTTALELLKTLPDLPERTQQEVRLLATLGPVLTMTKGYGASEVAQVYTRLRDLSQQMGESAQLPLALWGLLTVSLTRAEYTTALEIAERLLDLARKTHDTPLLVAVHSMQGLISQHVGEHLRGRAYLEHGSAVYDAQPPGSPTVLYGQDGGVACRAIASACWWLAGYPDQALTQSYAALALAHERAHPFSLALALSWTAIIHQFRREWLKAQQQAEAAIALCTEQGFSFWLDTCILYRGRALVSQGHREEGIRQVRQAVATRLATGAELDRPWCLASLAEVCQEVGQVEEGLSALAEALAIVNKTGARFWEAELYRLKGELTLAQFRVQGLGSKSNHRTFIHSSGKL